MFEVGPIYSVVLIDTLPFDPDKPDCMLQQMPSREDLESVRRKSGRVAAGYEVLLYHWWKQREEIESKDLAYCAAMKKHNELVAEIKRLNELLKAYREISFTDRARCASDALENEEVSDGD